MRCAQSHTRGARSCRNLRLESTPKRVCVRVSRRYAMLIPALLMGNVAVLKLPAIGGLVHILTAKAAAKALPPGVLNFVSGAGRATMGPIMEVRVCVWHAGSSHQLSRRRTSLSLLLRWRASVVDAPCVALYCMPTDRQGGSPRLHWWRRRRGRPDQGASIPAVRATPYGSALLAATAACIHAM